LAGITERDSRVREKEREDLHGRLGPLDDDIPF
jgi:hypothetical protein